MSTKRDRNHPKRTKAQLKEAAQRRAAKQKKKRQDYIVLWTLQFAEDVWIKKGTVTKDWEFTQNIKEAERLPNRKLAALALVAYSKKGSDPFNPNFKRGVDWLHEHGYAGDKLMGYPKLAKYKFDLRLPELDKLASKPVESTGAAEVTSHDAGDTAIAEGTNVDGSGEGEGTPHSPESDDAGREHPAESLPGHGGEGSN